MRAFISELASKNQMRAVAQLSQFAARKGARLTRRVTYTVQPTAESGRIWVNIFDSMTPMTLRAFCILAALLAFSTIDSRAEPVARELLASRLSYMAPFTLPPPDRLEAAMNETLVKFHLKPDEPSRSILVNILLNQQASDVPGYDLLVCLHEATPMKELSFTPQELLGMSAQLCSAAVKAYRSPNKLRTRRDDEETITDGLLVTWTVATNCSDMFFIKGGVLERIAASKGINVEPLQNAVWAALFGQSADGIDTELLNSLRKTASVIKENIRLNHKTFCEQWGAIGLDWGSLGRHSEQPKQ